MAIIVQSQPEAYGLANNDNPFVFFSTNYTPTQRFKIVVLPVGYPSVPALSTVRVYPRVAETVGGTVQLNKAFYDPLIAIRYTLNMACLSKRRTWLAVFGCWEILTFQV